MDPFLNAANFLLTYLPGAMVLALVIVGFLFLAALDNPVKQSHLKFAALAILVGGIIALSAAGFVPLYLHAVDPTFVPATPPPVTPTP